MWIPVHAAVTITKCVSVLMGTWSESYLSSPESRLQHSSYQKGCMMRKFTGHLLRIAVFVCVCAIVCAC